jgi:hypothetical protein
VNATVPTLANTASVLGSVPMMNSSALGMLHAGSGASACATKQPWCVTLLMCWRSERRSRQRAVRAACLS